MGGVGRGELFLTSVKSSQDKYLAFADKVNGDG
jgi:hypothetical protein